MTSLHAHHIPVLHTGICSLASGRAYAFGVLVMLGMGSSILEQDTNDTRPESWKGTGMT